MSTITPHRGIPRPATQPSSPEAANRASFPDTDQGRDTANRFAAIYAFLDTQPLDDRVELPPVPPERQQLVAERVKDAVAWSRTIDGAIAAGNEAAASQRRHGRHAKRVHDSVSTEPNSTIIPADGPVLLSELGDPDTHAGQHSTLAEDAGVYIPITQESQKRQGVLSRFSARMAAKRATRTEAKRDRNVVSDAAGAQLADEIFSAGQPVAEHRDSAERRHGRLDRIVGGAKKIGALVLASTVLGATIGGAAETVAEHVYTGSILQPAFNYMTDTKPHHFPDSLQVTPVQAPLVTPHGHH